MLVGTPKLKLLIVGVDGASFDLIDRFRGQGLLPNFERLLGRAASAGMSCTLPAHTAPGWASVVTGLYPGRHGIYQFFDTQDPDYGAVTAGSGSFGCSTIWDWLTAQGWSVGIVNVPMSHPPRNLSGFEVTWPLENTLRYCHPRTLLGELARHGAHFQPDIAMMYRGDLGYIEEAIQSVRARLESMRYLLGHRPVDAAMLVFTEIDRVCHHYWHFFDHDHPLHEDAAPALARAIERIHVAVDTALGMLLELVPDDTTVVVVSDHGFGAGLGSYSVHRALEGAGLLATRLDAVPDRRQASWFSDDALTIDWDRTRAYMPVPGSSAININLRGRQRRGIVEMYERDRLVDEITAALLAVRGPGGEAVIADVIPRERAFPGPMGDRAPDLLVLPRLESTLLTPTLGGPAWQPSHQTGLHRVRGMWIHASPHVATGRLGNDIRIVDVAPTLCADVGAAFPSWLDGEVVNAAFVRAPEQHPLAIDESIYTLRTDPPATEDEVTSSRLRGMGYL